MKLEFIIVCDNAFFDRSDRLSIIQAFDLIEAPSFPAIHPRISIATKWNFEKGDDKSIAYKQKLVIIRKKTGKTIFETAERKLTAKPQDISLQYINAVSGLKFDSEGVYKVRVFMNGKKQEREASLNVKTKENQPRRN